MTKEQLRQMIRQGKPLVASHGTLKNERDAQSDLSRDEGVKIKPNTWGV